MNSTDIDMPLAKSLSLWALIGISSWADAASFAAALAGILAAFYSVLLISEWFWKKVWRPLAEWRGWIKPMRRRVITVEEYEAGNTDRTPL